MQNVSDSENEMETGTFDEEMALNSPKPIKFGAHLPHSDSTILSIASTYINEVARDNR